MKGLLREEDGARPTVGHAGDADAEDVMVRPIRGDDLDRVTAWLVDPRNARWLDFGPGVDRMDRVRLEIMTLREDNLVWVYGPDDEEVIIGVVALGSLHPRFGTAELWAVLGEKAYGRRDLTIRALASVLRDAFDRIGLRSVYARTVEINRPARRALHRLGFRAFGRQRSCHVIDGRVYDRLWFDLLADDFDGYLTEWR